MKSGHITKILDEKSFAELSTQQREIISAHAADCSSCRRAFESARVSSLLLKLDSETVTPAAPSPFFQAKVMNAWRERQIPRRPIAAFRRWWQASAMPVFMMLATMAVLISLTFLAPQSSADDSPVEVSSFNLYSTESVILNQKQPKDLTTEQVFQVIYASKTDSRK
jgi:predicted anti-sigma-YlaC factor YlaD